MKQETSTGTDDVLTVWTGQLLIFALKADLHDLTLLRNGFVERVGEWCADKSPNMVATALAQSSRALCHLMAQRYSWRPEAEELLSEKVVSFCTDFVAGNDMSASLTTLRIMDSWSGLSSCLASKLPFPVSFLDYLLDTILPVLAGELVNDLCNEVNKIFVSEKQATFELEVCEEKLKLIVKRLCFNSCLDKAPTDQLSLAILMHLPMGNNDFAMKTGFIYKLLQNKYAQKEVR